jgi:hypothetical protein
MSDIEVHSAPTPPPIGPAEGATVNDSVNAEATAKAQLKEGLFKDSVTGALGNIGVSVTEAQNYLSSIGFDKNGHPVPPQPNIQGGGIPPDGGSPVGKDVTENIWFSGNALLHLRLAIQEYQKVNREMAREMGLLEASLTALWGEIQKEVAKETKKSYQEQAKMAMYEVVAGAISMTMGVISLGVTLGSSFGGMALAKGSKTVKTKTSSVDGAGVKTSNSTTSPTPATFQDRLSGFASGAHSATAFTQPMGQISGGTGEIISGSGKIVGNENLAKIESDKILFQAMAEQIKKAWDTLSQEAKDALSHNDEIRRLLQQVNEQYARLFGSITAH